MYIHVQLYACMDGSLPGLTLSVMVMGSTQGLNPCMT
jgi:hypothetical protein